MANFMRSDHENATFPMAAYCGYGLKESRVQHYFGLPCHAMNAVAVSSISISISGSIYMVRIAMILGMRLLRRMDIK